MQSATTPVEINGALRVRRLFRALRFKRRQPPALPSLPRSLPPPNPPLSSLMHSPYTAAPAPLPHPTHRSVRPLNQCAARGSAGPSPGNGSEISCFIPGHLRKVGHAETTERCGRGRLYSSSGWLADCVPPPLRVAPVDLMGVLFEDATRKC